MNREEAETQIRQILTTAKIRKQIVVDTVEVHMEALDKIMANGWDRDEAREYVNAIAAGYNF